VSFVWRLYCNDHTVYIQPDVVILQYSESFPSYEGYIPDYVIKYPFVILNLLHMSGNELEGKLGENYYGNQLSVI